MYVGTILRSDWDSPTQSGSAFGSAPFFTPVPRARTSRFFRFFFWDAAGGLWDVAGGLRCAAGSGGGHPNKNR